MALNKMSLCMNSWDSFQEIKRMSDFARTSWTIWFQLYSYEFGGHEFGLAIQIHRPFFEAVCSSCQHLTMINLHELFKGRKDTNNFGSLIQMCKSEGRVNDSLEQEFHAILDKHKPLINKVGKLRGNYFGHKTRKQTPEETFRDAGLKIRDIDVLLDVGNRLVWKLACLFPLREPKIRDDENDLQAKKSLEDILQSIVEKFNSYG